MCLRHQGSALAVPRFYAKLGVIRILIAADWLDLHCVVPVDLCAHPDAVFQLDLQEPHMFPHRRHSCLPLSVEHRKVVRFQYWKLLVFVLRCCITTRRFFSYRQLHVQVLPAGGWDLHRRVLETSRGLLAIHADSRLHPSEGLRRECLLNDVLDGSQTKHDQGSSWIQRDSSANLCRQS